MSDIYEFAIRFSIKSSEILLLNIRQLLEQTGFQILIIEYSGDKLMLLRHVQVFIHLKVKQQFIDNQLEALRIEVKRTEKERLNLKKQTAYDAFMNIREYLPHEIKEMEQYKRFKVGKDSLDEQYTYLRQIAIYQILAKLTLTDQIKGLLIEQGYPCTQDIKFLFVTLKDSGLLLDICPLRTFRHSYLQELKNCYKQGFKSLDYLVLTIKNQLGEQIGMYFAFLLFLIKSILIIVILGVLTYFLDEYFHYDVNTSPFETIYALFAIFWGAYFVGTWLQEQKKLAILWRSEGHNYKHYCKELELSLMNSLNHHDTDVVRKSLQQKQKVQLDFVTGLPQQYRENLIRNIFRGIYSSLPYLLVQMIFLIASLNARGYMKEPDAFLHMSFLQGLAMEGAIFDINTSRCYIPTVIHVLFIAWLNIQYKTASIASTMLEGHDNYESFEKSLIFKRFIFESFSAFTDFFYIGFIRADIRQLKYEMFSMFMVDEVRRVVFESILPTIQKVHLTKVADSYLNKNPHLRSKIFQAQLVNIYLPKYESFDDYLEIILNFGYLCFFTSAYRMAGIVIALFLVIEFLSDYYKVYHLYQKPFPIKTKSIGPWTTTMDIITIISVFTNLLLFSLASEKIVEFFPWLFKDPIKHPELLQAIPKKKKQSEFVFILFVIEHVLLLVIFAIRKFLSTRTLWTHIYLKRKQYKLQVKN